METPSPLLHEIKLSFSSFELHIIIDFSSYRTELRSRPRLSFIFRRYDYAMNQYTLSIHSNTNLVKMNSRKHCFFANPIPTPPLLLTSLSSSIQKPPIISV